MHSIAVCIQNCLYRVIEISHVFKKSILAYCLLLLSTNDLVNIYEMRTLLEKP